MPDNAVEVRVYGHVQGVGFRYFTQQQALRLGLRGRASNLPDGSVVVFARGEPHAIDQFLAWLQQGPRSATVTRTVITHLESQPWESASGVVEGFRAY